MTTPATDAIGELRRWIISCGLPRKRLARLAGCSPAALQRVELRWNPKAETVEKLERFRCEQAAVRA